MTAPAEKPTAVTTPASALPQSVPVPEASIITVNTNEKHRMLLYMPSVWAAQGNFEVIIADNASTDGSIEFIQQNFPQTRLIHNGGNLGFAGGNNRGAREARAEILVFLNPDTTVEPDWLVELLKPFKDSTVGATTSRVVLMPQPQTLNACGTEVHISGLTLCRGMGRPRDTYPESDEVSAIMGAAFAIRREIFEQVGGFNESFFIYMEEVAISVETWLRGWRCLYVPGSVVHHDYVLRFGPRKTLYQERNRYFMLLQIYKWPTLLVLLPTLLLAEIVTWGFVIARDRKNWKNKFQAYAAIFKQWGIVMAKRRINQRERKVRDRDLLLRTCWALDFGQVTRSAVTRFAGMLFNPLFWALRAITLLIVRW
jgi:GT2 family glycosyltransferase